MKLFEHWSPPMDPLRNATKEEQCHLSQCQRRAVPEQCHFCAVAAQAHGCVGLECQLKQAAFRRFGNVNVQTSGPGWWSCSVEGGWSTAARCDWGTDHLGQFADLSVSIAASPLRLGDQQENILIESQVQTARLCQLEWFLLQLPATRLGRRDKVRSRLEPS